jgi:hypothetical protein
MSYCRFSTYDVYCYPDVASDVDRNAASRRNASPAPKFPELDAPKEAWQEYNAWLRRDDKPMVDIELPHAGESFFSISFEEAIARLKELKELGYRFPDTVIQEIEEDAKTIIVTT